MANAKQMLSTEHHSQKSHTLRPQQATRAEELQSSPSAVQVAALQATRALVPFIIQTRRAPHLLQIIHKKTFVYLPEYSLMEYKFPPII